MPLFGFASVTIVAMLLSAWQEGLTALLIVTMWTVSAIHFLGVLG